MKTNLMNRYNKPMANMVRRIAGTIVRTMNDLTGRRKCPEMELCRATQKEADVTPRTKGPLKASIFDDYYSSY